MMTREEVNALVTAADRILRSAFLNPAQGVDSPEYQNACLVWGHARQEWEDVNQAEGL